MSLPSVATISHRDIGTGTPSAFIAPSSSSINIPPRNININSTQDPPERSSSPFGPPFASRSGMAFGHGVDSVSMAGQHPSVGQNFGAMSMALRASSSVGGIPTSFPSIHGYHGGSNSGAPFVFPSAASSTIHKAGIFLSIGGIIDDSYTAGYGA